MRRDGLTSGSSLSSSPSPHPLPLFTVFQGGRVLRGLLSSPLAPRHWAPGGGAGASADHADPPHPVPRRHRGAGG